MFQEREPNRPTILIFCSSCFLRFLVFTRKVDFRLKTPCCGIPKGYCSRGMSRHLPLGLACSYLPQTKIATELLVTFLQFCLRAKLLINMVMNYGCCKKLQ